MTPVPYETLCRIKDPFLWQAEKESLAIYAKEIHFNGFKTMLNKYIASEKAAKASIIGNATEFSDQPCELECGVWECNDTGIYRETTYGGREYACAHPIMPIERLVNIDTGEVKIKLAFRRSVRSNWQTLIVDKDTVSTARNVTGLAKRGVAVTSESAKTLVSFLADIENLNYDRIPERKSIGRLGYIPGEGFSPYVEGLIFDGDANFSALFRSIKSYGSSTEWYRAATECRKMSTTAKIMLSASFASVLLEPIGALPFFVHLWGVDSGTGKTVALMLAASVWGNPAVGEYIKTFDSTVVGAEKTAAFLNHLPLCLDELQLSKNAKGQSNFDVYKLAQGVGRTRGNKAGGVDVTPTWKNCILTTGESPITGMSAGAGAVNRVIDIECTANNVVIKDGARLSNALKRNYGFAGRIFVEKLYSDEKNMDVVRGIYQDIFKDISENDTTEKQSMAAAAIMTADALATEWIFKDGANLTMQEVTQFLASKSTVSAGDRAYKWLCDWASGNAASLCGSSESVRVLGKIDGGMVYIIRSVFDSILSEEGYSTAAILSFLKSSGLIETRGRNYTKAKRINGVPTECVCMKLPAISEDDLDEEIL